MFSNIKNALLDRTNRPREEEDREEDDKRDSEDEYIIEGSEEQEQHELGSRPPAPSDVIADVGSSESEKGLSPDNSTDSGSSNTSSQPDPSGRSWKFVQCGSPSSWLAAPNHFI